MKQKIFLGLSIDFLKKEWAKATSLFLFTFIFFLFLVAPLNAKQEPERKDEGFSTNEFGNNPPNDSGPQIYTDENGNSVTRISPPPPAPSNNNTYNITPEIYVNPDSHNRNREAAPHSRP